MWCLQTLSGRSAPWLDGSRLLAPIQVSLQHSSQADEIEAAAIGSLLAWMLERVQGRNHEQGVFLARALLAGSLGAMDGPPLYAADDHAALNGLAEHIRLEEKTGREVWGRLPARRCPGPYYRLLFYDPFWGAGGQCLQMVDLQYISHLTCRSKLRTLACCSKQARKYAHAT